MTVSLITSTKIKKLGTYIARIAHIFINIPSVFDFPHQNPYEVLISMRNLLICPSSRL
jgi:hypothetical protein